MEIPPSSQGWADRLTWLVYGVLGTGGFAALLNALFSRKKQPSEIAKIDADTEATRVESNIKLSGHLGILHDRINGLEATLDRQREEAAELRREAHETRLYHREQMKWRVQCDQQQMNRRHAYLTELSRLMGEIRKYELMIYKETGKEVGPVPIRTADDIEEPFPMPPAPE